MTRIILASASPRRRELIRLLGLPVQIQPADIDEMAVQEPDPAAAVRETARRKALALAGSAPPDALIIGSDTTVALERRMLGKPRDAAEASQMLAALRGRTHHVHTGIAVLQPATRKLVTDVATVAVPMRRYSDAEIEAYVATGDPLDKAGAYAIQNDRFRPVPALTGCYAAVMGLPLCHLVRALQQFGVTPVADVAEKCQSFNAFRCTVFPRFLDGTIPTQRIDII